MNSLHALFASIALIAPMAGGDLPPGKDLAREAPPGDELPTMSLQNMPSTFGAIEDGLRDWGQNQVRIEQRVIIRISPSTRATREEMLARLPKRAMTTEYREVPLDSCVPISAIAGVEPVESNRLLLFMRDRRVLSAALDRACDAQAFYSGFYVERSEDGMLCKSRDTLHSRTGTTCEVARFNRLIAVRD